MHVARKFSGLVAHQDNLEQWNPDADYAAGAIVEDGGHQWQALQPVARRHRPQGVGDGSTEDRQRLLDELTIGWAAGTTGGGLAGTHYVVTNASDNKASPAPGSFRYVANQAVAAGGGWITFDDDYTINFVANVEIGPNLTIDGRGHNVTFAQYPIEFRTDPGSPVSTNRGLATANIVIAYVNFINYPNGTSVVEFGGNNPFQRGGADLVYLHHCTIADTADQQHSNGAHDNMVSRSTTAWCRWGPAPGPKMMSQVIGGGLKLFRVDATDVTTNTITALDPLGNPTSHNLLYVTTYDDDGNPTIGARGNWTWNGFKRNDYLTAHPFPTGTSGSDSFLAGHTYNVRHWGGGTGQTFTADSATSVITCTGHGFGEGDPVVLYDTTKGTSLPGAATTGGTSLRNGYIYFVKYINANTFKLAAKPGGGAKDFSDNGSGTLTVKKADLTKFQVTDGGNTGWDPVDLTTQGTGQWIEETEPLYFENGKGPQWGSHHDDDMPDGLMSFRVGATDTIDTMRAHLISDGQRVRFFTQGSNLPTGITSGTLGATYYARDVTATTFKLAATLGGPAITIGATAGAEQTFTADAATDTITATGHGLSVGDMWAAYGTSLPGGIRQGVVYWVKSKTANTFQITQRKGDVVKDLTSSGSGTMTMIKRVPQVQLVIGPNRATITLTVFDRMKIRSPKLQCSWVHEFNCWVYHFGDPDRGDTTGGFGTEMGDGAQVLAEGNIYESYPVGAPHYWSVFTNPPEIVPVLGPSVNGINMDAATAGPVQTLKWQGGTACIERLNKYENGATTRDATSGATVIVSAARLDWYDAADPNLPVPYAYNLIPVTDPFILKTMLDRGAGNVQPWELVS